MGMCSPPGRGGRVALWQDAAISRPSATSASWSCESSSLCFGFAKASDRGATHSPDPCVAIGRNCHSMLGPCVSTSITSRNPKRDMLV